MPAEPKDGGPIFAEWPLVYNQKRLLTYALGKFKPYVKEFMAVSGQNILRDAPFDHLHHHSLMYGIRVNGVNFWEEVAGCGYQKPVKTENWIEGKTAALHSCGKPSLHARSLHLLVLFLGKESYALHTCSL